MSLYLGKDNSEKSLFHITNSTYSKELLQAGNKLSTTVFNTSLGYPSFTLFEAYRISIWRNLEAKDQNDHYCAYFSQEAINFLLDGIEKQFFVIVDGELYSVNGSISNLNSIFTQVFSPANIMWAPNDTDAWGSAIANTNFNVLRLHYKNPNNKVLPTKVTLCVSDVKVNGVYTNFFNGNGITLSSNGLLVGNKNLSDYRYIIDSPINSVDTTYLSNGSYKQIVNSVSSNDSTFTITTNNGVEVYYGSKKVIDSKVLIKSYIVQSLSTFTKGELTNGTHYICSSPNLNCILLLSMKIGDSNSYISKYFDMSKPDYEELFAFTIYGIVPGTSIGSENYYYWKKVGTNLYLKYVQTRDEPWNIPASLYTVTILDT